MDDCPQLPLDFSILTERLLIRRLRESDVGEVNLGLKASLPELKQWHTWAHEPQHYPDTFRFVTEGSILWQIGQSFRFGCFGKDTGEFINHVELHYRTNSPAYEIGYWSHTKHTGNGYMQEAVKGLLKVGFEELKANRMYIRCDVKNGASNAIPKKLGFESEGVQKNQEALYDGTLQDMEFYAHTPATWENFKLNAS